jgi:hypothetical protein
MTNGRQKGSGAEREVAKAIQTWWQFVDSSAKFVRTPLSGGWSTPQVRGEFRASGDLMTTSVKFPYCVEIKRREAWSMMSIVENKPSPVWKWWEQTEKAAREAKLAPMLWFRKNREPWLIMLRVDESGTQLIFDNCTCIRVARSGAAKGLDVVIILASEFLKLDARHFA